MLLAENLENTVKCEYRIWLVKCKWAKPKPLYKQKEQTRKVEKTLCVCSFSVSEVFANAKVKLLCREVRANARVKLSLPTLPKAKLHYPQDNFTYEVNFTYPWG